MSPELASSSRPPSTPTTHGRLRLESNDKCDMADETKTRRVVLEDESNYEEWLDDAEFELMSHAVWHVAVEAETPADPTETTKDRRARKATEERASGYLLASMSPTVRKEVRGDLKAKGVSLTHPSHILEVVKARYGTVSVQHRALSLGVYLNLDMEPDEDPRVHFEAMRAARTRVGAFDLSSEEAGAILLLRSIDDQYKSLKAMLLQEKNLTVSRVETAIKLEWEQRRLSENLGDAMLARRMKQTTITTPDTPPRRGIGLCDRHSYDTNPNHTNATCIEQNPHLKRRRERVERPAGKSALAVASIDTTVGPVQEDDLEPQTKAGEAYIARYSIEGEVAPGHARGPTLDSGATTHMTGSAANLFNVKKSSGFICVANGRKIPVTATGSTYLVSTIGTIQLDNVLVVPGLSMDLVAVGPLTKAGLVAEFRGSRVLIRRDEKTAADGEYWNELYTLNGVLSRTPTIHRSLLTTRAKTISLASFHRRNCHVSVGTLDKAARMGMFGKHYSGWSRDELSMHDCAACIMGKGVRTPDRPNDIRSSRVNEMWSFDLLGPTAITSKGGSRWILVGLDDYSRRTVVTFLRTKKDVLKHVQGIIERVELEGEKANQQRKKTSSRVSRIHSDRGTEFKNNAFEDWTRSKGILQTFSPTDDHNANARVERVNLVIGNGIRTNLIASDLPANLWPEMVAHEIYVRNRLPHSTTGRAPISYWQDKPVQMLECREIGASVYVRDPNPEDKMSQRYNICRFLGFVEGTRQIRAYDPRTKTIWVSTDVRYPKADDEMGIHDGPAVLGDLGPVQRGRSDNDWGGEKIVEPKAKPPRAAREKARPGWKGWVEVLEEEEEDEEDSDEGEGEAEPVEAAPAEVPALRRSGRKRGTVLAVVAGKPPRSLKEILNMEPGPARDRYLGARVKEFASLDDNEAFTLVKRTPVMNVHPSFEMYREKIDAATGQIDKAKARWIVNGSNMIKGVEYKEAYAPTAIKTSWRVLVAIAAERDWPLHKIDVKTAFLHGKIDADVYVAAPVGQNPNGDLVAKLDKAVYGTKQGAKCWNEEISTHMKSLGFKASYKDQCVWLRNRGGKEMVVLMHVDDQAISGNDMDEIKEFKASLERKYGIVDSGEMTDFLGMRVRRDRERRTVFLDLEHWTRAKLQEIGFDQSNPTQTPLPPGYVAEKPTDEEVAEANETGFPFAIWAGCLSYLANTTRPELAQAATEFSQNMARYGSRDIAAAKHSLRYLNGTADYGILFGGGDSSIVAYADASWATDKRTRRSQTGLVTFMNGGPVDWKSKLQSLVATSTADAEIQAMNEGAKSVAYVELFSKTLGAKPERPLLRGDNTTAIAIITTGSHHQTTKHHDVNMFFCRERYQEGHVDINHVRTDDNIADIFTKALHAPQFKKLRLMLGVRQYPTRGGASGARDERRTDGRDG
jgi:transposase InsO family protein